MGRGPASIRGRTRLAHALVPMVLRKRACAMPKKVPPIAASARNCSQTISQPTPQLRMPCARITQCLVGADTGAGACPLCGHF
jgi:hypothetical protein